MSKDLRNDLRPRYSIYPVIIKGTDGFEERYYCFQDNNYEGRFDGRALYYNGTQKDFFKIQCAEDAISFVNLLNSKDGEYLSR
jgi:hypothetical protein